MSLHSRVVHVMDASWRKSLQSQRVVHGDGDPAWHRWVLPDYTTYLSLKRKVATLMLGHLHPVHPLQGVKTTTTNELNHIMKRGRQERMSVIISDTTTRDWCT